MLYSKTFSFCPCPARLKAFMLATLLLICQPNFSQTNDLIGTDMGMPSSQEDNNLIDIDKVAPPPTPAPTLSPAEAAELVRNKLGGQVMSVNTQHLDSGVVYGVKVLNDGHMRVINVDGQTGQLLNQ